MSRTVRSSGVLLGTWALAFGCVEPADDPESSAPFVAGAGASLGGAPGGGGAENASLGGAGLAGTGLAGTSGSGAGRATGGAVSTGGVSATAGAAGSARAAGAPELGPMHVLLFTEVSGVDEAHNNAAPWDHFTRDDAAMALTEMAAAHGFTVEHTSDSAGYFTSEALANYDAVVFASTTGTPLDVAEQQAFEAFIGAGGGFVGIHAAADCHYNWAWYAGLVGGLFLTHAENPNVETATLLRQSATDPATAHLEASFMVTDEWYTFRDIDPAALDVLVTVDEASYLEPGELCKFGEMCEMPAGLHPIAWKHEYSGGRGFYTNFGHVPERYADPWFRQHLLGGLLYAAGRL